MTTIIAVISIRANKLGYTLQIIMFAPPIAGANVCFCF